MSTMPQLDCFRVSVHTDWSRSSEYFFFYAFTVNFNVYSEVCLYPKKNHFYPILGNLPRFGEHCFTGIRGLHSCVIENSGLQGSDSASRGMWFLEDSKEYFAFNFNCSRYERHVLPKRRNKLSSDAITSPKTRIHSDVTSTFTIKTVRILEI
jgi:hypothetical protein